MSKVARSQTKRKIITIDNELCNGCGECVTSCSEGALKIVDGKATLIREDFCDGFGDCIGKCPTGALKIENRESRPFDEQLTIDHLRKQGGEAAVEKMIQAQKKHADAKTATPSDLTQWPIQLHLVSPSAPFFQDRELIVMSTCAPLASADVHWRFLRGRSVVVACPKLDNTGPYAEKLAKIFRENNIPKVIVARMEVPCCGGLTFITKEAAKLCGKKNLVIEEQTIAIQGGAIKSTNTIEY